MYLPRFTLLSFFFHGSGPPRDLHSFPTRRSSDLGRTMDFCFAGNLVEAVSVGLADASGNDGIGGCVSEPDGYRSEEHTSELQSRGHLVCRLLLEKKKKKQITDRMTR